MHQHICNHGEAFIRRMKIVKSNIHSTRRIGIFICLRIKRNIDKLRIRVIVIYGRRSSGFFQCLNERRGTNETFYNNIDEITARGLRNPDLLISSQGTSSPKKLVGTARRCPSVNTTTLQGNRRQLHNNCP